MNETTFDDGKRRLPANVIALEHQWSPATGVPSVRHWVFYKQHNGAYYRLHVRGVVKYDPTTRQPWEDMRVITSMKWVRENFPSLDVKIQFERKADEFRVMHQEKEIDPDESELAALGLPTVGSQVQGRSKLYQKDDAGDPEPGVQLEIPGRPFGVPVEAMPDVLQDMSVNEVLDTLKKDETNGE